MKTINFGEKKLLVQIKVHGRIKLGNENNCIDRSQDRTLIHCVFGRNAVEVNLEKKLPKMKSDMADFIEVKQVETSSPSDKRRARRQLLRLFLLFQLETERGFVPRQLLIEV